MLQKFIVAAGIAAASVALPASASAQTIVGGGDDGNCYPFSCFASDAGVEYQQVYSGSAFGGTETFNTLTFFRYDGSTGSLDSADYTVNFYLTPFAPGNLQTTGASNLGASLGSLGTFSLSGPLDPTLALTGNTITYDPTLGNLLMQVLVSNVTLTNGYQVYFQADSSTGTTSRYYSYDGTTGDVGAFALRTQFSLESVSAVPEPSTWAMMLVGFGGVGFAMRRSKKADRQIAIA